MTYSNQNIASKLWVSGSNPDGITRSSRPRGRLFRIIPPEFKNNHYLAC